MSGAISGLRLKTEDRDGGPGDDLRQEICSVLIKLDWDRIVWKTAFLSSRA